LTNKSRTNINICTPCACKAVVLTVNQELLLIIFISSALTELNMMNRKRRTRIESAQKMDLTVIYKTLIKATPKKFLYIFSYQISRKG